MPSVSSPALGQRSFKEGFTFGARPPGDPNNAGVGPNAPNGAARRGHHHKHSLSHNFFSFLEPGQNQELITSPTPTPISPWNPVSPFTRSPSEDGSPHSHGHSHSPQDDNHEHAHSHSHSHSHAHDDHSHSHSSHSHSHDDHSHSHSHSHDDHSHSHSHSHAHSHSTMHAPRPKSPIGSIHADPEIDTAAVVMAGLQFVLGAALWVSGQQIGSLACTGLGYWVVFDSFGVALGKVVPSWLSQPGMKDFWKRPYG